MTNKSMLSVPRELLERWKSNMQGMGLQDMPAQIDAILAAPAEDARAVVDEPVAWNYRRLDDEEGPGIWQIAESEAHAELLRKSRACTYEIVPLYRRPQRPVVMPERDKPVINDPGSLLSASAAIDVWNACLDEFARLNPQ